MRKHPYRAVLIWAAVIVALVNIYPTIGWMSLSDEARIERSARWDEEDDEYAREKHGVFEDLARDLGRWAQFDRSRVINLGLDLQGGIHMVLSFDIENLPPEKLQAYRDGGYEDEDIEREIQEMVLDNVRRRVNEFEAKEPIIQALGANQIQIQLPGEKDLDRARRLITKVAVLDFHIVAGPDETGKVFLDIRKEFPTGFAPPFVRRSASSTERPQIPVEHYGRVRRILEQAKEKGLVPEGKRLAFSQTPKPYEEQFYDVYLIDDVPAARGEGLTSAIPSPDQSRPPYYRIGFAFSAASSAEFAEATGNNVGKALAIVVDGVVESAPNISERISGGRGEITGNFEAQEAMDLAIALRSGSLVVPVREEFTNVVGATLGADTVRKGVASALGGIALVGVFMVIYYLGAGLVALVALVLNAVLVIAAMAYFGMTLTLPGIAGLILTVGMAVDANVLIFERIREELRLGHALATSVDNGFARATITILDANITTLIAAAVLMQFGTGPIEGFAVTLSIGVCASVFTALVVSRAIIDFGVGSGLIKKLTMLSLIRSETKIPFLQGRFPALVVSVAIIAIGFAMFGIRGGDNFGVDFTQGTNITLKIDAQGKVPVGDVREALGAAGFTSPIVQESGDDADGVQNRFLVRVGDINEGMAQAAAEATEEKPEEEATADTAAAPSFETVAMRIQGALAPLTADGAAASVETESEQTVGPSVGRQLRNDALLSMFYALAFIVVYLTIRFQWKFAVGAVIALLHDVLITIGLFALLQRQISMPVVAALLTIIGYSLNDTIVVFDRIRENTALYRGKGLRFIEVLNLSINGTLSRTLLTSLTTLFVVVVLFLFGGDAINDFALALILGIIVGTYSSIFIASPAVYWLEKRFGRQVSAAEAKQGEGGRRRKRKKPKANGATA